MSVPNTAAMQTNLSAYQVAKFRRDGFIAVRHSTRRATRCRSIPG